MLMRLNIRCHLPFFFSICTDQYLVNTYGVTEDLHFNFVVSVCTLAPCILKCRKDCRSCVCTFTNLEAQERYLSIIRGAPQSTLITGNVCSRLLLLLRNTPDPQYLPSYPCAQWMLCTKKQRCIRAICVKTANPKSECGNKLLCNYKLTLAVSGRRCREKNYCSQQRRHYITDNRSVAPQRRSSDINCHLVLLSVKVCNNSHVSRTDWTGAGLGAFHQ